MFVAELSILISFVCFIYLFAKKAYPALIRKLDEYIASVKKEIDDAAKQKADATVALNNARLENELVQKKIDKLKAESQSRIQRAEAENHRALEMLKAKAEKQLGAQLDAQFAKEQQALIEKLADVIVQKTAAEAATQRMSVDFAEEDLRKLI